MFQDIRAADLVISHAGAGTCIEVLEAGKPLIVIVNDDLMDNHQVELAERLGEDGYLVYGTAASLVDAVTRLAETELRPYPAPDTQIFSSFVDKIMGES